MLINLLARSLPKWKNIKYKHLGLNIRMARKPAFVKKTKKAASGNNNSNLHFSNFEDYFDYGVKRETDGERFSQSDTKKSTNAFNDALNCYKVAIKLYNENPGFYSGDIKVYQNISYNYLRVKFDLLSEFKYVAGEVDIIKYIPDGDINKELKDFLSQDDLDLLDGLRNDYEAHSLTLEVDISTWDFFFNYLAFLSSYIEWTFELGISDLETSLHVLQRQVQIFDQLKESGSVIFDGTYSNHQDFDDPVLAKNMEIQKDTMFLPNQYNQNFVNTMSKLDVNSLLEMDTLVLKSINTIAEMIFLNSNSNKGSLQAYHQYIETLQNCCKGITQSSLVTNSSLITSDLQEEINSNIYKETEESLFFTTTYLTFFNPDNIQLYLSDLQREFDNINPINRPVVVDLLKAIVEIVAPMRVIKNHVKKGMNLNPSQITNSLGDIDMFYQVLNMVVKFERQFIMNSNDKLKSGEISTIQIGSEYCNMAELFIEVAEIETLRSFWKRMESKLEESDASKNLRKTYLNNAYSFVVNDLGTKETKKDKYYRLYLKASIENMLSTEQT